MKKEYNKITLYYPDNTLPVSVTGRSCSLNCRHCGGHYLRGMKDIADFKDLTGISDNINSVLLSGGSDASGAVPLAQNVDFIKKLKGSGYRLNIHTGLLPEQNIPDIAPLADVVSFDFTTDDQTIREVYGTNRTGDDYIRTFSMLREHVPVMPHVTIGLAGGVIRGEFDAISKLAKLGVYRIIFLVFIPTKGTSYESCSPPSIEDVEKVFCHAREQIPEGSFGLGCMHPRGAYKFKLENLCLDYGFESFVNPSKQLRDYLEKCVKEGKTSFKIDRELLPTAVTGGDTAQFIWERADFPDPDKRVKTPLEIIIRKECCTL
jgi:lipoyl synthase